MANLRFLSFVFLLLCATGTKAQEIAVLQYKGGGDWYSNPTALPNLIAFCNQNLQTRLVEKPQTTSLDSPLLFDYPFVHMTGHGNVFFSDQEAQNLREYLLAGGFLHIDDNYGMDPYIRRELKKVFPDEELAELGSDHPIFNQKFSFPDGLPKIHEHDNKRPQAFGISNAEGRLMLLFTFESDLGDGWEDPSVHNDPEEIRRKALQMGANILSYAFKYR